MPRPLGRKARVTRRRSLRALAVVAATIAPLVVPTAAAGASSISLSTSRGILPFGESVTVSGVVSADRACEGGRTVLLRWAGAGGSFSLAGEGTTAADGSFAFEQAPPTTGRFRATLPAEGPCAGARSEDVVVRVRAVVVASGPATAPAGTCIDLSAVVAPAKPGQTLELQRRANGGWETIERLPLNGDGRARGRPCLEAGDVGGARYRFAWSSDGVNEEAVGSTLELAVTRAPWMERIDEIVGGRPISVSVGEARSYLYRHLDRAIRTPASNQKLLLAMAMLDRFGPEHRIPTLVGVESLDGTVVRGDLWLLGRGDPIVSRSSLAPLVDQLAALGVERVSGRVVGSTTYFRREWHAPGWNSVATDYVNRPTALTFEGNRHRDPELAAAAAFTKLLERGGIDVRARARAGAPPQGLETLAAVESKPLTVLLAKLLRPSWNFGAEVLGKALGAEARGTPGTIAKGAATIEAWVRSHGAEFTLFDNSGLSYDNRVHAAGIVRLLWAAEAADWGDELRRALPTGGQGTLRDRLRTVELRAKTGTLSDVSALSGWVWADRLAAWVEFSIVSNVGKPAAADIEDKIVRILHDNVG